MPPRQKGNAQRVDWTRDLQKGQVTKLAPDKLPFSQFAVTKNFRPIDGDLRLRNGTVNLGASNDGAATPVDYDAIRIGTYKKDDGDVLVEQVKDGVNSKIISIDVDTMEGTDLIELVDQEEAGIDTLNSRLYAGNQGASAVEGMDADGTTFQIALPADSGNVKDLVSNGERAFVTTDTGLLIGSDVATSTATGRISTFTPAGTDTKRAVICNTNIMNHIAIKTSGRVVCVAGKNRVEIHVTPDFTNAGISVYPADINTMKDDGGIDNIGVESRHAMIEIGGYFWLKPNDDRLVRISKTGSVKVFRDNSGQLSQLDFSNCAMGYDSITRTLNFTGQESNGNIVNLTFDMDTFAFSQYDGFGIRPYNYSTVDKKLYFLKNQSNEIVDAFIPGVFKDDGEDISYEVLTAFTFGNDQKFYKWAFEAFLNFIYAQKEFAARLALVDGKIGGEYTEIFATELNIKENSSDLDDAYEILYESAPGELEVDFGGINFSEFHDPSIKVNRSYYRAGLRLTGSTDNFLHLRGMGLISSPTSRKKMQNIYN